MHRCLQLQAPRPNKLRCLPSTPRAWWDRGSCGNAGKMIHLRASSSGCYRTFSSTPSRQPRTRMPTQPTFLVTPSRARAKEQTAAAHLHLTNVSHEVMSTPIARAFHNDKNIKAKQKHAKIDVLFLSETPAPKKKVPSAET